MLFQRRDPPTHSIQILYHERSSFWKYGWSVYTGPAGEAVNPCKSQPGFYLVSTSEAEAVEGSSIESPPLPPPNKTWYGIYPVPLEGLNPMEGVIKTWDKENPPTIEWGNSFVMDFHRDAQFDDTVMVCGGWKFHRAWAVEY